LRDIYASLDTRLRATTKNLALPCYEPRDGCQTCSQCCHESVFLTPLEWLNVVDYAQTTFEPSLYETMIRDGLALYANNQATIDAFMHPPPEGERDHFSLANALKFTCPLLGKDGCSIYPAREILGRLFGQSFNKHGGIYGCALSGAFFGARTATLVKAEAWAVRLEALPLTGYRQVYPWFFKQTYGG
jgi:Fe-S-cluster containining protein